MTKPHIKWDIERGIWVRANLPACRRNFNRLREIHSAVANDYKEEVMRPLKRFVSRLNAGYDRVSRFNNVMGSAFTVRDTALPGARRIGICELKFGPQGGSNNAYAQMADELKAVEYAPYLFTMSNTDIKAITEPLRAMINALEDGTVAYESGGLIMQQISNERSTERGVRIHGDVTFKHVY